MCWRLAGAAMTKVLDAACGEGYGSALLAQSATAVVGVDNSADTVGHARQRYGKTDNLQFRLADCTSMPFADEAFDRIVSFETLEHLEAQDEMLAEFRRVLRPGGFLILSSPDKAVYSDQQDYDNEFHIRELYCEEFLDLIGRHFPAHHLLGQKLMFHSVVWSMQRVAGVKLDQLGEGLVSSPPGISHAPMYFIALCAVDEACLPAVEGQLWLFDDLDESVYQHYRGEIKRNMAAGGIVAGLEQEIEVLRGQLPSVRRPWWQRLLQKF